MTKAPILTENPKKLSENTKTPPKTSTDFGKVSLSSYCYPTGVFKPACERPTFPLTTKAVQSKGNIKSSFYRPRTNSQPKRRGQEHIIPKYLPLCSKF